MKIKIINFGLEEKYFPKRKHYNDAGADLYSPETVTVHNNETVVIDLKFGLHIPDGFSAYTFSRSGLSTKGIMSQISPVDSGYKGPIHAIITNLSGSDYVINEGDRISQLVVLPTVIPEFVVDLDDERGEGGLGSTGKR